MKEKIIGLFRKNDRRGLALVSVLSLVTLATILVMALFTVSEAEYKASTLYADGNAARHLADSAINIVVNQIQSAATGAAVGGATRNRRGGEKVIWASQPGAVRTYSAEGGFLEGRKLYSSSQMVMNSPGVSGETAFTNSDQIANDWQSRPDEWTDLNAPVVKVTYGSNGAGNTGGGTPSINTIFPVLDPRSYDEVEGSPGASPSDRRIEGFMIAETPPDYVTNTRTAVSGVDISGNTENWRVPLPVRWLYVLQDGTVGTMQQAAGGSGQWNGSGGPAPTQENPIVGRIAFWTDDESTKININTAAEPAVWELPLVYHKRDYDWANNQPVVAEYQRYPGHPATVALSTVLMPGFDWDTFPKGSSGTYNASGISFKNTLYELLPKLGPGGTQDGSRAFDVDDYSSTTSSVIDAQTWRRMTSEKLNISLDEFAFEKRLSNGRRELGELQSISGKNLLAPDVINRNRFFLTAHSRTPETNMFGYPRVAMWPLPDATLGPLYRTNYDTAVQMAATLGESSANNSSRVGNLYAFSRIDSRSSTADGLGGNTPGTSRNRELMRYLDELIGHTMPGAGGRGGRFSGSGGKYLLVGPLGGSDARQILVQIFDYIRCTNLFDARLYKRTIDNFGLDLFDPPNYNVQRDSILVHNKIPDRSKYFTYTEPRFRVVRRSGDVYNLPSNRAGEFQNEEVVTGAYPGHGQVTPIDWVFPGDTFTYKGFGRFPTISEVALHFICTADGLTSDYSYIATRNTGQQVRSGGKVAVMLDPGVVNLRRPDPTFAASEQTPLPRWYSNIPPFPSRQTMESWGLDFTRIGAGGPTDPIRHPAWRAVNWNVTLDRDVPLLETEKRIQVAIQFETFIPSAGWTKYVPDWTIVMAGESVSNFKVRNSKGQMVPVFETTEDLVLQSNEAYVGGDYRGMREGTDTYPIGGAYGTTALMNGRSVRPIGSMPADSGYTADASSSISGAMRRFPFVSNFITVARGNPGEGTDFIEFENGGQTIDTASAFRVSIYPSHDWQGARDKRGSIPVQTFELDVPGGRVPMPSLVVHSSEWVEYVDASGNRWEQQAVPAVRWWSFNRGGAVNQYKGSGNPGGVDNPRTLWQNVEVTSEQDKTDLRTHGRLLGQAHTTIDSAAGNRTNPVVTRVQGVSIPTAVYPEPRTLNRNGRTITGGNVYGFSSADAFNGTRASKELDNPIAEHDVKSAGFLGGSSYQWWGSDSIRSIIPKHGDYRLIAAMKNVPRSMWMKHPVWDDRPNALFAHSLTGFSSTSHPGVDLGGKQDPNWPNPQYRLVPQKWYPLNQVPDIPLREKTMKAVTKFADFDNGVGVMRDGAYINKPDDGNLSVMGFWVDGDIKRVRNAYFLQSWIQTPLAGDFFGPNRLMPSPGMLGSLPTGVFGSLPELDDEASTAGVPWRTLLFRPSVVNVNGIPHIGRGRPGFPADHLFMDLFWMPLVDPRPYSYGCATEGKVNINFQILPFRHVVRTTGVRAVLKGEFVTAINSTLASRNGTNRIQPEDISRSDLTLFYKREKPGGKTYPERFWQETDIQFHQPINAARTLSIMHARFKAGTPIDQMSHVGLFRTASEFTEVHLVPEDSIHFQFTLPKREEDIKANTYREAINQMALFWQLHALTGDNAKERPYTNIYQKITTKSNVFRIYFKAQTIKKAKSLPPNELDTTKDTVTAEYQGSALIERYLDFKNDVYPDYAARGLSELSLEHFYRYRVIDMKQFAF